MPTHKHAHPVCVSMYTASMSTLSMCVYVCSWFRLLSQEGPHQLLRLGHALAHAGHADARLAHAFTDAARAALNSGGDGFRLGSGAAGA